MKKLNFLFETRIKRSMFNVRNLMNCQEEIVKAADLIRSAFVQGNKLILFGNGGSAADAQHVAAEFIGAGLPAIALSADSAIVTALSNDFDFDNLFKNYISAVAKKDDVAIGISTSGESENVIRGLEEARKRGCLTIALIGSYFVRVAPFSEIIIDFKGFKNTAEIQEVHIMVGHILFELVTAK